MARSFSFSRAWAANERALALAARVEGDGGQVFFGDRPEKRVVTHVNGDTGQRQRLAFEDGSMIPIDSRDGMHHKGNPVVVLGQEFDRDKGSVDLHYAAYDEGTGKLIGEFVTTWEKDRDGGMVLSRNRRARS